MSQVPQTVPTLETNIQNLGKTEDPLTPQQKKNDKGVLQKQNILNRLELRRN